ncbi:MAG: prepilin-type N-terminal cleavage/methylation domain-containing protein [bacterium]|nr:prepilin-type N-terminal cleavage/methylation domain-containing protein [bacterium]
MIFLKHKGFSIIEIIIAIAIFSLISAGVFTLGSDIFKLNNTVQDGFNSQEEAKKIIRPMSNEIRTASQSNLGAYPILQTATSSFSFFSDIDSDGLKEQVRYFLSSSTLKKGVVKPTGNPLSYSGSEVITEMIHGVRNSSSTPIFEYYDSTYTGTSTPLSEPVSSVFVRLVKITVVYDINPNRTPIQQTITTQVSLRNLKDNL